MNLKYILTGLLSVLSITSSAQLLSMSLKSNNQQLIDEALKGAVVRVDAYYDLCDTLKNEHFGRNGKDFFNKVSTIGVVTEKGLLCQNDVVSPWGMDGDFKEFEAQYKPNVTKILTFKIEDNNDAGKPIEISKSSKRNNLTFANDSTYMNGLRIDSISGQKDGWAIFYLQTKTSNGGDSIKIVSQKKELHVSSTNEAITVEAPASQETVLGGIFVTPVQTGIGQISMYLTGYIAKEGGQLKLIAPYISNTPSNKVLTPISAINEAEKFKQIKKKRK